MNEFILSNDLKNSIINYPPSLSSLVVDKGHVKRFAESIGDTNPLYFDSDYAKSLGYLDIITPPTFLRCVQPNFPDILELSKFKNILDVSSEWEYIENVYIGDTISSSTVIKSVIQRKTKVGLSIFLIGLITYLNQNNSLIASQKFTYIKY
jgi:hypothetical protein